MIRRVLITIVVLVVAVIGLIRLELHQELPRQPTLNGVWATHSMRIGDVDRVWSSYSPPGRRMAAPLLIVLHGSMGTPNTARIDDFGYGFDTIADERNLLVVYPQGIEGQWNNAARAGDYAAKRLQVDDVGFLRALVKKLVADEGVDRGRIFLAGVSSGGSMVLRMALQAPDVARGYAVIAQSLPTPDNLAPVPTGNPVSIMFMHGTKDPIVPFEGGEVVLWPVLSSRGTVRSADATVRYFLSLAEVSDPARVEIMPDLDPTDGCTVKRSIWVGPKGHRVEWVAVLGGGHSSPNLNKRGMRLLGNSNRDISAADEIWRFFESI